MKVVWAMKRMCLWPGRFAMCKGNCTAPAEVLMRTSRAQGFSTALGSRLEFKLVLSCCFRVCQLEREMRFLKLHMPGLLYRLTLRDLMCNYIFVTLPRVRIFSRISQQLKHLIWDFVSYLRG